MPPYTRAAPTDDGKLWGTISCRWRDGVRETPETFCDPTAASGSLTALDPSTRVPTTEMAVESADTRSRRDCQ